MTPDHARKLAEVESAIRRCEAAELAHRKAVEDDGKPMTRNCAWMELNESEYQFKSLWREVRDVLAEYARQREAVLAMIEPVEKAFLDNMNCVSNHTCDDDDRGAAREGLREAQRVFGARWMEIRDLLTGEDGHGT